MSYLLMILGFTVGYLLVNVVGLLKENHKLTNQMHDLWLQRGELQAIADEFERRLNEQDRRRLYMRSDLTMQFSPEERLTCLTLPGYTDDGHRIIVQIIARHRPTALRAINAIVLNADFCEC